jgi:cell wall-associated NlpC family hydrolase
MRTNRRAVASVMAAALTGGFFVAGTGAASAATRTTVSGWARAETRVAGTKWSDTVVISPGTGRTVDVQQRTATGWVGRKVVKLGKGAKQSVAIALPGQWDDAATTTWRLVVRKSSTGSLAVSETKSVTVKKQTTVVSGWAAAAEGTAGKQLSDTVTITPGTGRSVQVQQYAGNAWATRATVRPTSSTPKIVLPAQWDDAPSTKWRLRVPATATATAATSPVKTVKVRPAVAPSSVAPATAATSYLKPVASIAAPVGGGLDVRSGSCGAKAFKIRQHFGIYTYGTGADKSCMTQAVVDKVKAFQTKSGLTGTGVVDKTTWTKMGFNATQFTTLDTYIAPMRAKPSSTSAQRIEAMVEEAKRYVGKPYVWGASNDPGVGADCSGMVLQALYAAGLDVRDGSTRAAQSSHFANTATFRDHPKLRKVPFSQMKRGDILYGAYDSAQSARHVAIYLGNGEIVEEVPSGGRVAKLASFTAKHNQIAIRPFG